MQCTVSVETLYTCIFKCLFPVICLLIIWLLRWRRKVACLSIKISLYIFCFFLLPYVLVARDVFFAICLWLASLAFKQTHHVQENPRKTWSNTRGPPVVTFWSRNREYGGKNLVLAETRMYSKFSGFFGSKLVKVGSWPRLEQGSTTRKKNSYFSYVGMVTITMWA